MRASQRRVHLWMWLVVGPLACAAVVAAVVMRAGAPDAGGWPDGAGQTEVGAGGDAADGGRP